MDQRVGHLFHEGISGEALFLQKQHQIPVGPKRPAAGIGLAQGIEQTVVVSAGAAQKPDGIDQAQQGFGAGSRILSVVEGQEPGKTAEGADLQKDPDGYIGKILLHELFGLKDTAVLQFISNGGELLEKVLDDGIAVFKRILCEIPHQRHLQLMFNGKTKAQDQVSEMHIQCGQLHQVGEVHMMIKPVSVIPGIILEIGFDFKEVGITGQKLSRFFPGAKTKGNPVFFQLADLAFNIQLLFWIIAVHERLPSRLMAISVYSAKGRETTEI